MTFKELGIIDPILRSIEEQGYTSPTPIQEKAIPILLKGKDLMGCAQTGTGKTAAFSIPIIQHLVKDSSQNTGKRKIKALIVTPTRELAIQIDDNLTKYAKHTRIKNTVIFGGVKQGRQVDRLKQGVDILVATPGRLLDLINQKYVSLRDLDFFVLDEADQMLDMGFIHDIKKLLVLIPNERQSLFFSATMPKSIVELSNKILGSYETVTIKPDQPTAEKVEQSIYFVNKQSKINLLIDILNERKNDSTLVFSRTKHGADKIVKKLAKVDIKAAAIHGNKAQNNRQRALSAFKDGKIRVLIATDIAARGIDVSELALVINFDLPNVAETYVHRIGRTGRASASGIALSFCMPDEKGSLRDIQKLIKQEIPVIESHAYVGLVDKVVEQAPNNRRGNRSSHNSRGQSNQKRQQSKNKSSGEKSSRNRNNDSERDEARKSSNRPNSSKNRSNRSEKSAENKSSSQSQKRNSNRDDKSGSPKDPKRGPKNNYKKKRSNSNKDANTGKKRPDRGYLKLLD